ncbi:hypothetical protein CPB85DRAFT_1431093 [Mucidula mucida]|nr:hypothetical protein CPB85DRAFT_1431093 [Mucidula mucida]
MSLTVRNPIFYTRWPPSTPPLTSTTPTMTSYLTDTYGLRFPPNEDPFYKASKFAPSKESVVQVLGRQPSPLHPAEDDFNQSISDAVSTFKSRCTATETALREELEAARARERDLCRRIEELEERNEGLVTRNREVDEELKDVVHRLRRCSSDLGHKLPGYSRDAPSDSHHTSKRRHDCYDHTSSLAQFPKASHHHKSKCRH